MKILSSEDNLDRRYLLRNYNSKKVFLVSDLHLGIELEWHQSGLDISNPQWSFEIIRTLRKDILETNPTHVLIVGDLEHSFRHFNKQSKKKVQKVWVSGKRTKEKILEYFKSQILSIEGLRIGLIRGNQDTEYYNILKAQIVNYPGSGVLLFDNKLGVFHGNIKPSEELIIANEIVLGHVHPAIELKDEINVKYKLPVFVRLNITKLEFSTLIGRKYILSGGGEQNITITILPAYNHFFGGYPINKTTSEKEKNNSYPILKNILNHPKLEVKLTDGVYLGRVSDL
ncbi:hypothetical protein [Candidatus Hodarchaeum mangrovi]